jgi:hypothetical protein
LITSSINDEKELAKAFVIMVLTVVQPFPFRINDERLTMFEHFGLPIS